MTMEANTPTSIDEGLMKRARGLESEIAKAVVGQSRVIHEIMLALLSAERLCAAADLIGAMSLEALLGSHRAFDKKIHDARSQPGQRVSAANLRKLLRGSEIEIEMTQIARISSKHTLVFMRGLNGCTMTK